MKGGSDQGAVSLGRHISILHRFWQIYVERELDHLGIGSGQLPILIYLLHVDVVSQAEIVRHLHTDKSSTARTIRKLVDQGYVERRPSPDDARAYNIRVTEKARKVQPQLLSVLRGWTEVVRQDLSEREKAQLFDWLGRIIGRAKDLIRPDSGN